MTGYNTECVPQTTQVLHGATRRELHLQLTVIFACGRKAPYGYSHRFKPAENRRPCKRCAAAAETLPTLSWKQVDQRFAEEYARLADDTGSGNAPAEAIQDLKLGGSSH